jgi:hypothetical protein
MIVSSLFRADVRRSPYRPTKRPGETAGAMEAIYVRQVADRFRPRKFAVTRAHFRENVSTGEVEDVSTRKTKIDPEASCPTDWNP